MAPADSINAQAQAAENLASQNREVAKSIMRANAEQRVFTRLLGRVTGREIGGIARSMMMMQRNQSSMRVQALGWAAIVQTGAALFNKMADEYREINRQASTSAKFMGASQEHMAKILDDAQLWDEQLHFSSGFSAQMFADMQNKMGMTAKGAEAVMNHLRVAAQAGNLGAENTEMFAKSLLQVNEHLGQMGKNGRITGQQLIEMFKDNAPYQKALIEILNKDKFGAAGHLAGKEAMDEIFKALDSLDTAKSTLPPLKIGWKTQIWREARGMVGALDGAMQEITDDFNGWQSSDWHNLWVTAGRDVENVWKSTAGRISKTAYDEWEYIGKQMGLGAASGVAEKMVHGVEDASAKAVEALRKKLGIHSPSTVMRDRIGANMGAGIEQGLAPSANRVSGVFTAMLPRGAGFGSSSVTNNTINQSNSINTGVQVNGAASGAQFGETLGSAHAEALSQQLKRATRALMGASS